MLRLPRPPRQASLRAFAAAVGLLAAAAACVASALAGASPVVAATVALAAAAAVAGPGLAVPNSVGWPYRAWNRAAREYATLARRAVVLVAFAVVAAAALIGSTVRLARPADGESLWEPRDTQRASTYASLDACRERPAAGGWMAILGGWAVSAPRNAWTLALLPFVLLLDVLRTGDEDPSPPPGIYTLY
jgi:hypothetical protein